MSRPGDWMKNVQTLADVGHALGGYAIVLTADFFEQRWLVVGYLQLALATYVLAKEYWYDLRYESEETVASSTRDALGYAIGCAVAWGVLLVHAKLEVH